MIKKTLKLCSIVAICATLVMSYHKLSNILETNLDKHKKQDASLINLKYASDLLKLDFADSHVASPKITSEEDRINIKNGTYIGSGMLYYGLVYSSMSKVAVIIGSGGGFVPKIVAQAQKDAAIKDAVTYLVDAHVDVHYSKPSWQTDKFFADNIYTLNMRSSYAAKLFTKEDIKIDFLHVDGDHSTKGVLEDWHYYKPLLSKNAIIVFHDYSFIPETNVGIHQIQQENPELKFIFLPDSGTGVAVAQLSGLSIESNNENNRKTLLSHFKDNKHSLLMEDAFFQKDLLKAFNTTDHNKIYDYLKTEKFQQRYKIVADFIDDSNYDILEIGGFPNNISYYVNKSHNIHSVEPYGTTDWINNLYLNSLDKKLNLTIYPDLDYLSSGNLTKYNLVMLGFCMQYNKNIDRERIYKDVEIVFNTIYKANKIAIENPNWPLSMAQNEFIKKIFRPEVEKYIRLDLNDPDANHSEIYVRNIYLINKINPIEGWNSPEVINQMIDIILGKSL